MTRKSKREIEHGLDELDGGDRWDYEDVWHLNVRLAYDEPLSPKDERLKAAILRGDTVLPPGQEQFRRWVDGIRQQLREEESESSYQVTDRVD